MTELQVCSDCRRHVRGDHALCPFCEASIVKAKAVERRAPIGRMTRAAIFAGSLAGVSSAGCSGGTDSKDAANNVVIDAGADADPADPDAQPPGIDASIPMPYGAPPARSRFV